MPNTSDFQARVCYDKVATITIASSTTISDAVDLGGCSLVGLFLPATFDGTTLTLQACSTIDGTYVAVEDGAASPAVITLSATAHSKYIALSAAVQDQLRGLRFIKLVCGTAQTTTNTLITLATRPL